jgi:RNA polymerase sigma-70 factor (ECF subfamily)
VAVRAVEGHDCPGNTDVNETVADPRLALNSTIDLVARVRQGDHDALETLCLRCLKALNCYAAGRIPPRVRGMVDTQDLVAEALEKGLKKLSHIELEREGAFVAYLRRIFKNLVIDQVRAAERRPLAVSLHDRHEDNGQSPLERALDREQVERYEQALDRLRPRDAEVIILRLEQQAGYEEIAAHMGFATGNAARVAVRRALYRLAHEMSRLSQQARGKRDGDGV